MRGDLLTRRLFWAWSWALVLLVMGTGCAMSTSVRLDAGSDSYVVSPRNVADAEGQAVEVGEAEWTQALPELARTARPFTSNPMREAWWLFGDSLRSGGLNGEARYDWDSHRNRLVGADAKTRALHFLDADDELASQYSRWCKSVKRQPGDCLGILEGSAILSREARNTLALSLAMSSVLEGAEAELRNLTNARALVVTIGVMLAVYFTLLAFPDLSTKGLAAVMTVVGVGYLGADVFFGIIGGWMDLMRATDKALTFDELREAGERFGLRMGEKAARVFVMLAMAAMGGTAQQLASKVASLPGSSQAALASASQAGVKLGAVASVESVAINVASGELSIALAPNAVAMSARSASNTRPARLRQTHHLATNKNYKSRARGGPWSPKFEEIFNKAGMDLDDTANKVPDLLNHKGPHAREYHEAVYDRLFRATRTCRTMQECRMVLEATLKRMSEEVSTPGSPLFKLLFRVPSTQ